MVSRRAAEGFRTVSVTGASVAPDAAVSPPRRETNATAPRDSTPTDAPAWDETLRQARRWAARDAAAAIGWATAVPREHQPEAWIAVSYGLSERQPIEALALAQEHQLNDQPGTVAEDIVQQWASRDLAAALAWTTAQPAGDERDRFVARVALVLSATDPFQAAQLVSGQMAPGAEQTEAAIAVLHQWAGRDFSRAAAWVDHFPTGTLRDRAVDELAGFEPAESPPNR